MQSTSHHSADRFPEWSRWLSGWRLALGFFAFACLVFGPLYNAGFVTDFLGWLECRETTAIWRAYECFSNRGLYFVPFGVLRLLTDMFWLHPLPWFLVWTGLHALNAFVLTDTTRRLSAAFGHRISLGVSLLPGLIFLLHPWQVEVVAWKACSNYLFAGLWTLLIVRSYLAWILRAHARMYLVAIGIFVLFLFTLEYALFLPVILGMLHWCLLPKERFGRRGLQVVLSVAPFFIAIGLWLLVNRLLIGSWVGHYGASTHFAMQPLMMASAVGKYLFKVLIFSRFLPYHVQSTIYQGMDASVTGGLILVGILVLSVRMLWRMQDMLPARRLHLFLLMSAIVYTVPVSNLYFYFLQLSENDRYTYLPMLFLAMWWVSVLWDRWGWVGRAMVLLVVCISLIGSAKMVRVWEDSTKMYWSHIREFNEPEVATVFLLNVPDNYRGTFMFRNIGADSAFEEVWHRIAGSAFHGKMYDIFQYNMTDPENDFIVTWEFPQKLKVEFAQWGNWWWRNGVGGDRYDTSWYTAWQEGKFYYVEFHQGLQDAVIRYHTPDGWKDVPLPHESVN